MNMVQKFGGPKPTFSHNITIKKKFTSRPHNGIDL